MTPQSIIADYRTMMSDVGETITIRRYSGIGPSRPSVEVDVLARVTGYDTDQFVGTIQQGDRKLIVLAEAFEGSPVELPLKKGDKAVVRGREMNIESVDDSTRRVGGTLVALEIQARS